MKTKQPILLAILDGFGITNEQNGNAVSLSNMSNIENLKNNYPWIEAHASGKWVGLPDGQMGNSEVGHLHIGAGRILYQSLSLINNAIDDKSFYQNQEIINAINFAKKNNQAFHIMGLLSDGGVHAHINHMIEILQIAKNENFKEVYFHVITDGRDTKPDVAKNYIKTLQHAFEKAQIGQIASISGRYYAMDRDKRWERISLTYDVIVNQKGASFTDPIAYIDQEYASNRNDEFIIPAFNQLTSNGYLKSNDAMIFANFRPDRAVQIASAITNKNYDYKPKNFVENIYFVSMMKYAETVDSPYVAFKPIDISNGLGEWLSKKGYKQLRIAETEKYAHVTYFFDGGRDIEWENAVRILIPSPKVATYDLKPQMAAIEITERLISEIKRKEFDVMVLNFANPDMVGHTGNLNATIEALKVVDECVGKLYQVLKEENGILILTADHGNVEVMIDEEGGINKKHTSCAVPIIITKKNLTLIEKNGAIAQIAPTILQLIDEQTPEEMSQTSLIIKKN